MSVRRYLSEPGEKEALRVLKEQLRHQTRVTSDDVRLAVRAVASQGGAVPLPPAFPPSRWVLEFKRVHGFAQFNSFALGAPAALGLPERLEVPPLRSAVAGGSSQRDTSSSSSHSNINDKSSSGSSASAAQATGSSMDHRTSSDCEKEPSQDSRASGPGSSRSATYSTTLSTGPRAPFDGETQRQMQLTHGSQRHRQHLQQQQRRAMLVDGRRRAAGWPVPRRDFSTAEHDEMRSNSSSGSENGATTGPSNSPSGGGGDNVEPGVHSMPPHMRQAASNNGGSVDEKQESASNASSSKDKRAYKLSHTVPVETWEKAIAAVEHQGMSLRVAAKMYGVHFAALHRRVKKRAQGGQSKGNNGYFHPSDEAGIMRVVVARAELGVLMTFDELMRLVEAAALRKLPDISVDSARKLLTRFQSRNEQSIRHIIDDWPPPRPAMAVPVPLFGGGGRLQHQPYLAHPGFDYGSREGGAATAAAVAAAASNTLFVPPSRLAPSIVNYRNDSRSPGVRLIDTMRAMDLETTPLVSPPYHGGCVTNSETDVPPQGVWIERSG